MKTTINRIRVCTVAALVCLTLTTKPAMSQTNGDSSRDALLQLVPDNVGVCFVLSDLKNAWPKVTQSKWFTKLKNTNLGKTLLQASEARDLGKFRDDLEKILNVKWQQIRDDVLGDQFVLAYFPTTSAQTKEHGLVMAHVRDAALFRRLVDRINKKQQEFGELQRLVTLNHEGVEFIQRIERKGNHFYWINGPIVAVSSQESLIRKVISHSKQQTPAPGDIRRRFTKANAADATAAVFINPRMLESEFAKKVIGIEGPEKLVMQSLRRYVGALQGIVVTLHLNEGIDIRLSLSADLDQLPDSGKQFFAKPTPPSGAWTCFPKDAMFAVAGRIHAAEAFRMFTELLPSKGRTEWVRHVTQTIDAAFHLDVQDDLLPNVGPDWGVCVFASANDQVLPEFLAAVAIRPGSTNVDQAVFRGLDRLAWSMIFSHNKSSKHRIQMKSAKKNDAELMYLECEALFPKGVRPTIALNHGYLLFASSPNAVARFQTNSATTATDEIPLARLSFRELHKWSSQNRKQITTFLAAKNKTPTFIANQIVGGLLEGLSIFDQAAIYQRTGDGTASWRLHLR